MPGAETEPGYILAIPGDQPEGGVEVVALDGALAPERKRLYLEVPVIAEGFHVRFVDRSLVRGPEGSQKDSLRPSRIWRFAWQLDQHEQVMADEAVAATLECLSEIVLPLEGKRPHEVPFPGVRPRPRLRGAEQGAGRG